jgi:hypothetical protein
MKTVKNDPKTYRRREVVAPKRSVPSKSTKAAATKKFLDAPVSADLYIDLGHFASRKA